MDHGIEPSEDLLAMRSQIRRFMDEEVLPNESGLDPEAIELPPACLADLSERARSAGLWGLWGPRELGGQGLSLLAQVVLMEEICRHRNGLYNPGYGVFGRALPDVCYACTPYQAERYVKPAIRDGSRTFFAMSEPTPSKPRGGADPAVGIRTQAVRKGDDWVINGAKTWISNGADAEWGVVFAQTPSADGKTATSCFFVEQGQFETKAIPVIRADYPHELIFTDCRVPHENLLGPEGGAQPLGQRMLAKNRIAFAASHLGVAMGARDLAAAQCQAQDGPLTWTLGDSETEIRAARWLVWEAAARFDRGEDFRLEASIAKLFSSECLCRVIDRAIQILGGQGVTKELPLERWYREARGRLVAAGPSEALRLEIARSVVGAA